MEVEEKRFTMPNTGHIASVGSIVIFEIGDSYPLIGKIVRLYREDGFVKAVIMQPSGRHRVRTIEHDARNGSIALLVGDDAKVVKKWFKTLER